MEDWGLWIGCAEATMGMYVALCAYTTVHTQAMNTMDNVGWVHACKNVCLFFHTYIHAYIYTYTCTHTPIHTHLT